MKQQYITSKEINMSMSPEEEPKQHTVKKVLDDDAASALMALASTAEKKGSDGEEVADVPTQPAACTSPATPRSPTITTKFPSKVSGIFNIRICCMWVMTSFAY